MTYLINIYTEKEFFVYTFTKENSIYPLLRFLNPLLKGVSPETVANVLNSINAMIKYSNEFVFCILSKEIIFYNVYIFIIYFSFYYYH